MAAVFDSVGSSARYLARLCGFLRHSLTAEECRAAAERLVRARTDNFLATMQGIFAQPDSPYRRLLHHAGVSLGDLTQLVRADGIEDALQRLYAAGVYVTLAEFKGRLPIKRGSLEFAVRPEDFRNPSMTGDHETRTLGSSGVGTRVINFDHLVQFAVFHSLFLEAFGLRGRPNAVWRSTPPPTDGFRYVLSHMKLGGRVERWFTPNSISWRQARFLGGLAASRLFGRPIALPEHVPLPQAGRVARWLADRRREGSPALLSTFASSAVRVCLAAREEGLDIAGTFFLVGGEPYTLAKARVLADAETRAVCHYTMSEVGRIGLACAAPADLDDVHLLTSTLAAIQSEVPLRSGVGAGAIYLTTVTATAPTLMLNVETGDQAVLEERACGCPLDTLGHARHLRRIRSYGKLTSEGMTFLGGDLLALVEEILPARFGGTATRYQLVEEEEGGLPRMSIIVSPQVGPVDEAAVVGAVLEFLGSRLGAQRMTECWRAGGTLRVVRREPYPTGTAKILPLHTLGQGGSS